MSVKIGVIVGSTRPTRVGRKVADWFVEKVKNTEGVEFEIVDLKDWELPLLDEPQSAESGDYQHDHTKKWSAKIASYDGFVWVTPEYNRSYAAPLKNAIDYLYTEWSHKPVAFLSYGGFGGARAVEQLKLVAVATQMVALNASVGILAPWEAFDENGVLDESKVLGSVENIAQKLKFWGEGLKPLRS